MPEFTEHQPGMFCWADLATPDAAKAKTFYSALFGWAYDDHEVAPGMYYSTIRKNGKQVAGLMQQDQVPPNWTPYICVADVDAAAAKIKEAGGSLLMEPHDVMDSLGRMIVAQDPNGAVFACWQPKSHKGAELMFAFGAMTWWEVYATDADKAKAFYQSVFDWTFEEMPMPQGAYIMIKLDGKDVGGMMNISGPEWEGVPPHWALYFGIEDVDAAHAMVKELGGDHITGCMDIPNNIGRFAVVKDSTNAAFTLFTPGMPE